MRALTLRSMLMLSAMAGSFIMCAPASAQQGDASLNVTDTLEVASSEEVQQAQYEHILFRYFQQQYEQSLTLIEVANTTHAFAALNEDDKDRLKLMQGASQLNLGLHAQAQEIFLGLLAKTTSEYVQANTWYWLAKAGFDKQQYDLAERAFVAIEQDELSEYITEAQWQELIYLNTHTLMQQNREWQSAFEQLSEGHIYPAYIQANLGSRLFNQGDFENAEDVFIRAKQALIRYQSIQRSWINQASDNLRTWLNFSWLNPLKWFADDPNAQAQGSIEKDIEEADLKEQNALFDRINLGLAYSLLQQSDDDNALKVINTISRRGGESEQALLTLGWAMAQENRWQNALNIWQYLKQESAGIYGLQASYGIAYAHQQRGDFASAFFALEDTSAQIQSSLDELSLFAGRVKNSGFFDNVQLEETGLLPANEALGQNHKQSHEQSEATSAQSNNRFVQAYEDAIGQGGQTTAGQQYSGDTWPAPLLDIKRLFLSSNADFDAKYLLKVRAQAQQSLQVLQQKAKSLVSMEQMLALRQQRYTERQQSLSLQEAKATLEQANERYMSLASLLDVNPSASNDAQAHRSTLALAQTMAEPELAKHVQRLNKAKARMQRLNEAPEQGSLNPAYANRIQRLQAIVDWQLYDNFPVQRQRHLAALSSAKKAIDAAQAQFNSLVAKRDNGEMFALQQERINEIAKSILRQQSQASDIFKRANGQLQSQLLAIVEQRIDELNKQDINTRLAKLRLQDLRAEQD